MNPMMDASNLQSSSLQWQGQAQAAKMSELQKQGGSRDEKKLQQAAKDFEAIFVHQMLDAMDKTVDREGSIMGGGSSEQYFRGMLNEEIAKSMTNRLGGSGFGLAESIYKQMAAQMKPAAPEAAAETGSVQDSGKTGEVKP